MSKRRPDYELTHENWNEDLPSEEAGSFAMASNEEIDKRVIKKAKRRLPESETVQSVFSNFAGFGKSSPVNSNGKIFDFLSTSAKPAESSNNVNVSSTLEVQPAPGLTTRNTIAVAQPPSSSLASKIMSKSRVEYLQQLRKLNEDFVAWVKVHFDKNPYLDLTPVFKDYAEHLKQIEDKHPDGCSAKRTISSVSLPTVKPSVNEPVVTSFTQSNTILVKAEEKESVSNAPANEEDPEEEGNYKTEVKVIEEENTRFKTRCKLFYKKDGSYADKGVGTLYIKSADDAKTSLLIRAETSLGNILLNIYLSPSIPVQRVGKNNVTLVCIPNPPVSTKAEEAKLAVTYLIRVKDAEMADELFRQLEEAKSIQS